ncbi:glycosyltransferase family 2 protein [Neobacillus sp. OS1-33]|uniref:glycosyltransferase family 2 protein n=1 Tax=Neobacillus sp. OS1-33 TaxID=3070683 RepID=UPI0027E18278|nr:glycosyltransferase family 2 protein [Neobacillus sp. OS1-33]WML24856.1 glycosyltransferase family 2 protein [Neobacillus sp. OS1-33]
MLFSMIIPVYNAEKYVHEAIESLINQTVNFKENVEIVLVDDGSTDQSKIICQNYVSQYPSNITYVYRDNAGPGSARNTGLNHVSVHSDYIGFLDADDLLSENSLEKVASFFSQHEDVQLAVIPLYHFERIDTPHRLNYRFERGDRVIHILEEYTGIHFHIGGCFFKAEHFLNNPHMRFQTDIKFWEDALFINTFLLEHKQYGVVSEAKYHYRRRVDEDSLVSNAWYQKSRYTEMIRRCYLKLINESKSRYNEILPYVQFLITYHSRLYLFPKNNPIIYEVLTQEEQEEFFEEFVRLIQLFDQKYIIEQDMPFYYKTYLLNLSDNGWPYKEDFSPKKIEKQKVVITDCNYRGLKWLIKGHFKNKAYFMKENDRLFIKAKDKLTYLPKTEIPGKLRIIWGTIVRNYEHAGFETTLPFYRSKFQFGLETESGNRYMLNEVNLKKVKLG